MPSTYTPNLRLELQATGENRSTWGIKANNDFSLIEAAITGYTSIAMADANVTLTANNAATDQARNAVLKFTGSNTAIRNVVIPAVSKVYLINNATTGGFGINVKTASGVAYTVTNGSTRVVYCDGTDCYSTLINVTAARLLGRMTTVGEAEEIPVGYGLEFSGGNLQVKSTDISVVPVGARVEMTGRTAPTGYLVEDGAAYSRTTYANLFNYYQSGFTSQTFTVTIATPAVFTKSAHGFAGYERIRLSTTGALPTGLNTSTDYFVTVVDANTFRLSTTQANLEAAVYVNTSGTQSGTQTYLQTLYGLGDGSTTFNVADRRGKFTAANQAGRVVGTEWPSVNKSHTHGVSDPTHAHGVADPTHQHYFGASYIGSGVGSNGGYVNATNNNGALTGFSGTGIGIYGAATGISIQASGSTDGYPRHMSVLSCVKY